MHALRTCDFCGGDAAGTFEVLPPRLEPTEAEQRRVVLCPDCKARLEDLLEPLLARAGGDAANDSRPDRTESRENATGPALESGEADETATSTTDATDGTDGEIGGAADGGDEETDTADVEAGGSGAKADISSGPGTASDPSAEPGVEPDPSAEPNTGSDADSASGSILEGGITFEQSKPIESEVETQATAEEESETADKPETADEPETVAEDSGSPSTEDTAAANETDGPAAQQVENRPPRAYGKVMRLLRNRHFPMQRSAVEELAAGAYDLEAHEAEAVVDHAVERGEFVESRDLLERPDS